MTHDPIWLWRADFFGGTFATFYADTQSLARDHALALARGLNQPVPVVKVTRLKHRRDVTADERAVTGTLQRRPR